MVVSRGGEKMVCCLTARLKREERAFCGADEKSTLNRDFGVGKTLRVRGLFCPAGMAAYAVSSGREHLGRAEESAGRCGRGVPHRKVLFRSGNADGRVGGEVRHGLPTGMRKS